jgi:GTPase SAR1 family protein
MAQQETPTLKLLLIGNSSVGKSSLLLRFTDDTFLPQDEVSATIGKSSLVLVHISIQQRLSFIGIHVRLRRDTLSYSVYIPLGSVSIKRFIRSLPGVDFKVSMMEVDGQKYKLTIWVNTTLYEEGTVDRSRRILNFWNVGHSWPRTFSDVDV